MKDYLDKQIPKLEIDEQLQKAFCFSAVKCSKSCQSCIYSKENLELFKQRFNELTK